MAGKEHKLLFLRLNLLWHTQDYLLEKKEEKAEKVTEVKPSTDDAIEEKPSEEVAPAPEEDVGESTESSDPVDEDNTNSAESVDQEAEETPEIKVGLTLTDHRLCGLYSSLVFLICLLFYSSSRQHQQTSVFQLLTKPDTASPDTLSITGG